VVANCHCRDCQKTAGGAFSTCVAVPPAAVTITKGEPRAYSVTAESGNVVTRKFCGACGAPLFSELEGNAKLMVVKAGSLDDPSWLQIQVNCWTDSAQPWAHVAEDLPRFPKNPPM
jgi:hypothetical protein